MKHNIHSIFIGIIFILSCGNSFAESSLTFKQAWIAEAPPVSKVLAAYMDIINDSDKTIIIASVESDDFDRIEIHRTINENNIAKMQHQKTLAIPASSSIKLEPGSYHMMLFNPKKKFQAGDVSKFTIHTKNDQQQNISVPVKKAEMPSSHEHHHH